MNTPNMLDTRENHFELPPLLHSGASKTLIGSAYARVRRDIIDGRLAPGSRLRVEHLKDSYGVSAGTLREALSLLVADALVVSHGRRGFHVMSISVADFYDITQTRILLAGEVLRKSIESGDEVWESRVIAAFHRLTRAEERLASNRIGFIDEWEDRNREFHQALASACSSRWMYHFLTVLHHQAERYRRLVLTHKPIPRDVHNEHKLLHDAALARDADLATRILSEHISKTYEAVKLLPESVFGASVPQ